MSRKDYIKLAEILKVHRRDDVPGFASMVLSICDWLKRDNPNFSKDRFIEAVYSDTIGGKKFELF